MFVRICAWMYLNAALCLFPGLSYRITLVVELEVEKHCFGRQSFDHLLHHNFKGFAPMTLKLWEKLRSGIVDTHPRRLQQLRQKRVASSAFQNDNWGRVPNTGRYQIPDPVSSIVEPPRSSYWLEASFFGQLAESLTP